MEMINDQSILSKGFQTLHNKLGKVDTIRFLSQIRIENKNYLKIQDELFKNMSIDDIFEKATQYTMQRH